MLVMLFVAEMLKANCWDWPDLTSPTFEPSFSEAQNEQEQQKAQQAVMEAQAQV